MIRIILADDHHLVRQGIRSLLEKADDIEIVAEATNGEEAVNLVRQHKPDVLVTDIGMPRLNGVQATEQIRELGLPTQVVILSMHSDETLVQQCLRHGAKAYILKSSVRDELMMAVRAAYRGATYLSPTISEMVMTGYSSGSLESDADRLFDQLSAQEREILKLVAEGYTNKAISDTMHISIKTVEKHRARLMEKLNIQGLAGLIRVAIKHGLIFLDE